VWSSATATDTGTIYGADLGSPYAPWSSVSGAAVADLGGAISALTSDVLDPVAVSVAVDPIGAVWVYYSAYDSTSQIVGLLLITGGSNGQTVPSITGEAVSWVLGTLAPDEGVEELAATFHAGGVALIGRMRDTSVSTYTGALMCFTLGGYTSAVRRPVTHGSDLASQNAPYEVDWYGLAEFGYFPSWNVSTFGSPTTSFGVDASFTVDCSGGATDSYTALYFSTISEATQGQVQVIAEVTAGELEVSAKSQDTIDLLLTISTSQIIVRNVTAGVDIETITLASSGPLIVRASWHLGLSSTVYWRVEVTPWTQGNVTVRSWDVYDGTLTAAVSAGDRIAVTMSNPSIVKLYHVGFAAGLDGVGMAEDTLTPRPFSLAPAPVYHGVNVAMTSGPTVTGDSWSIAPWYDFGVRRVFQEIEPSPRAKLKTTADAASSTTSLVFDLTDAGEPVRFGAPVLGMGFFGANFRTAEIATATSSSGPWTKIADVDLSCGLSGLAWERKGYTVAAPASSPDTGPH
jgi:hypothetical protein